MSSTVGIILPKLWKNKTHVPNHQPDLMFKKSFYMKTEMNSGLIRIPKSLEDSSGKPILHHVEISSMVISC